MSITIFLHKQSSSFVFNYTFEQQQNNIPEIGPQIIFFLLRCIWRKTGLATDKWRLVQY